jgi:5-methylcytosine-specific restriction endonuclease McrA
MKIPKALREQVWVSINGKNYKSKCYIRWCKNIIDVFNFQVGHNIPDSKGGQTVLENLKPLCSRCNQSMGNEYTIDEWNKLGQPVCCFWSLLKFKE